MEAPVKDPERVAAIVRAIRQVYGDGQGDAQWRGVGVVTFTVHDIFDFAQRLAARGVYVRERST